MSLVDPHTGRPIKNPTLPSTEQIVHAIEILHQQLQQLSSQSVRQGLFIEYLQERIALAIDEQGLPLIKLKMEEFPAWAQTRIDDMRREAEEFVNTQAQTTKVDLDG
jgi:hypothetical protein